MDKMEFQEKFWGGIFGIIAIIAAIVEAIANGISTATFFAAIKDVAGTLIVVVLLVTFIKQLPRKPKNLLERLEEKVEEWGKKNSPLIFKVEGYIAEQSGEYTQGFVLLQNPEEYLKLSNVTPESSVWNDYARYESKKTGKFIDLPSYKTMINNDFKIRIVMKQSHFSKKDGIEEIIQDIISSINSRYVNEFESVRIGRSLSFTVSAKRITTDKEMERFVELIDYIVSLVKVVM